MVLGKVKEETQEVAYFQIRYILSTADDILTSFSVASEFLELGMFEYAFFDWRAQTFFFPSLTGEPKPARLPSTTCSSACPLVIALCIRPSLEPGKEGKTKVMTLVTVLILSSISGKEQSSSSYVFT